jgi:putative tricarboxylic transport membrane protein
MSPANARKRDRIVGAVLILLSAIVAVAAWRLPDNAAADAIGTKAYPITLAVVLAGLSIVLMLGKDKDVGSTLTREMIVFGFVPIAVMLAIYVLLVQQVGFALCTVALLLACFRLKGERSWAVNVAVAVGSTLAIWVVFGFLLNVQLRVLPAWWS